jgi:hypothetical protein
MKKQATEQRMGAGGSMAACLRIAAVAIAVGCAATARAGLFDAWGKKMPITFSGYTRSETLTNFPVMVVFSNGVPSGFSYADFLSNTNRDLRFSDVSGNTELYYEIDTWNTNGASYVWVQVPALANNTTIYAYWGMLDQSAPAYTTNGATWDSAFRGVWHMNSANSTNRDSTAGGNHATSVGTLTFGSSGFIGQATAFGGSGNLSAGTNSLGVDAANKTLSAWMYPTNWTSDPTSIVDKENGTSGWGFWMQRANGKPWWWPQSSQDKMDNGPASASLSTWTHVVLTCNTNKTITFYINGQTNSVQTAGVVDGATGTQRLLFGAMRTDQNRFKGSLDEIRIEGVIRSSNWVWATYQNMASNSVFGTKGTIETGGLGTPSIMTLVPANITTTGASLNGSLSATGTSATAVWVFWGNTDQGATNTGWVGTNSWPAPQSTGTFSYAATLTPDQTYTYRYAASNTAGWAYGGPRTFNNGQVTVLATDAIARVDNPSDTGRFTVFRPNWATNGALTVSYSMSGSATNGVDYSPLSGSATILDGQSNVDVVVSALWNPAVTNDQQAVLTLSTGSGLYAIGSPNAATVTIVAATTWYVATNGSDSAAGTNWATAFQTVSNGVARAGTVGTVYVSNGSYSVSVPIIISNNITLRSVNGRDATTVYCTTGTTTNVLTLAAAGAMVDGFTFTNGTRGGVVMNAGTLRNSAVRSCGWNNGGRPGIYATGGLIDSCLVANCYGRGGGGIRINGANVVVRNSTLIGNDAAMGGGGNGGGVYIESGGSGALIERCVIANNSAVQGGGAELDGAGVLRNCLVVSNRTTATTTAGAGVAITVAGARVENCTLAANTASGDGAGLYQTAGAVTNTIVYFNVTNPGRTTPNDVYKTGGTFAYGCATPLLSGGGDVNNLSGDPGFLNAATGDYSLNLASPCVDAGAALAGIVTNDLAGAGRPQDGNGDSTAAWDMGAYEVASATTGALRCDFYAPTVVAFDNLNAAFTAQAGGTNLTSLTYQWDFDNNGSFDGSGKTPSWTYNAVGLYSVKLEVGNGVGETAVMVRTNYIYVAPSTIYAATNGGSVFPFATWANASTNIQNAVNAGITIGATGSVVVLSNGLFRIDAEIAVTNGITVRSLAGAAGTTVARAAAGSATPQHRIFNLSHAGAVLDGLTITNGYGSSQGAGITMSAGTVRNCVVARNANTGGINMSAGAVSNCVIANNDARGGAGVYMGAGCVVQNCSIVSNRAWNSSATGSGGVVMNGGGVLRNCLVAYNSGGNRSAGVDGISGSPVVESCTIAANSNSLAFSSGGGLYLASGTATSCIVWGNMSTGGTNDNVRTNDIALCAYSCAPELTNSINKNLTGNPLFKNAALGNFTLQAGSPCINSGTNLSWMANAVDLAGASRIQGRLVDMGAYEATPAGGTAVLFW